MCTFAVYFSSLFHNAKRKKRVTAWKVQCNCGIIYKFLKLREKKPKDANTFNAYRLIWDGQCIQRNGMMKEMLTSLCVADKTSSLSLSFSFFVRACQLLCGVACDRNRQWNGLKSHWLFVAHCAETPSKHLNRTMHSIFSSHSQFLHIDVH